MNTPVSVEVRIMTILVVCLLHEPIWGTYTDAMENYAFIYGTEYRDHTLFKLTNDEVLSYHYMPVPSAGVG
ncbi:hypothetical protein CHS0354_015199 [Potamilus streckersoni]|uniref:Uncharacterized protein n=1 Tax=Potamilus streckersoni TaxID=2493646 RepID=A0AAE0SE63_9BIVA|nr:hypothetical protein CHS0354_015199 [Potamilus streckersoni]